MPFKYWTKFSPVFRPPVEYWTGLNTELPLEYRTSEYQTSESSLFRYFRHSDPHCSHLLFNIFSVKEATVGEDPTDVEFVLEHELSKQGKELEVKND